MTKKKLTNTALILLITGMLTFFSGIFLIDHYARLSPRKPNQQSGQIYPHYEHGTAIYLTKKENLVLNILFIGGAVLGGAAAFLIFYLDKNKKRLNG